jgi:hypothetical protein
MSSTVSSNGSPELPTGSCRAGLLASSFWNHHEFAGATVHEHSAYFVGPTIHYEGQRWSATLGFLRQLPIGQASQSRKQRVRRAQQLHFGGRARKILRAAESRI